MSFLSEDFLTLPHIARALRLRYAQVYELLLTGEIEGDKVAGQWRIDPKSFQRFIERRGLTAGQTEE